jgi:tRNA(Ile)-lysidine synthase
VQAAAREARYRLLVEAAKREGLDTLLVAHHLEDQAETFLLRLARGSGVDGLSAMPPMRDLGGGVRLLRPLLNVPQARLQATLAKASLKGIEDPSNRDERFDRVKMRKQLPTLASLGLDAAGLARTASHFARARVALESQTESLLKASAAFAPQGYVLADRTALMEAPEEISLRALATILKFVSGHFYAPRFEALEAVYQALRSGTLKQARTLNGCRLVLMSGGDQLLVTCEIAAAQAAEAVLLRPGETKLWDSRFAVSLKSAPRGAGTIEVRALGADGIAALKRADLLLSRLPRPALGALPGFWKKERLVAAPHFGTFDSCFIAEARLAKTPFR